MNIRVRLRKFSTQCRNNRDYMFLNQHRGSQLIDQFKCGPLHRPFCSTRVYTKWGLSTRRVVWTLPKWLCVSYHFQSQIKDQSNDWNKCTPLRDSSSFFFCCFFSWQNVIVRRVASSRVWWSLRFSDQTYVRNGNTLKPIQRIGKTRNPRSRHFTLTFKMVGIPTILWVYSSITLVWISSWKTSSDQDSVDFLRSSSLTLLPH